MIYALLFVIGACIGSFLGVCIDRIPKGQSVITGRSCCSCGTIVPYYYNIPIISWLILRGRAFCCGCPISTKFFLIEVITACLFPMLWIVNPTIDKFVIYSILTSFLLVATFIDFDTMLIPDKLPIILSLLGIFSSSICPQIHNTNDILLSSQRSVLGMLIGSGILFWIGIVGELLFKKEAIGIGDIQLIGAIGTFCGINGCLAAIFGGSFVGTIVLLPIIFRKKISKKRKKTSNTIVPFVPFMTIGTILFILFQSEVIQL